MFIFLQADNFSKSRDSGESTRELGIDYSNEDSAVRRPYRGFQIKDDTYAVISVRRPDGTAIPLTSSAARYDDGTGKGLTEGYSDFIIQSIEESRSEKQQVIETFGEMFVYFYGEKPRFIQISGLLMNTEDFNWRAQFWENYDNFLRGSKLVESNARCYLAWDTVVVEGYPIGAVATETSDEPYSVPFQMTMLLTNYYEYGQPGMIRFPGVPAADLETLNLALEGRRKKFVSTGAEVRYRNLNSAISNQIPKTNSVLGAMRAGVQAWNDAQVWLGDKLDVARRLYGGRTLRMPIGAASYMESISEYDAAASSLRSSSSILAAGTDLNPILLARLKEDERFNSTYFLDELGNARKLSGSKLRVLGPVKFAPSWVSEITGDPRGMIFENKDEYPLSQIPPIQNLGSYNAKDPYVKQLEAERNKVEKVDDFQKNLALYNAFVAQGDVLGSIADVVNTVRTGYGMLLTAANFVQNPLGFVAESLGLSPQQLGGALSTLASGDFKAIGQGLVSYVPGLNMFLGEASSKSWENWADRVSKLQVEDLIDKGVTPSDATKGTEAGYGEAYGGSDYVTQKSLADESTVAGYSQAYRESDYVLAGGGERDYDSAYGPSDYTSFLDAEERKDEQVADAESDLPEGVETSEPNAGKVQDTLDNVYGNEDSAVYGEDREDAETLDTVYSGEGTIQKNTLSDEERIALLAQLYGGGTDTQTEDTDGITSVEDDEAEIDPVV